MDEKLDEIAFKYSYVITIIFGLLSILLYYIGYSYKEDGHTYFDGSYTVIAVVSTIIIVSATADYLEHRIKPNNFIIIFILINKILLILFGIIIILKYLLVIIIGFSEIFTSIFQLDIDAFMGSFIYYGIPIIIYGFTFLIYLTSILMRFQRNK